MSRSTRIPRHQTVAAYAALAIALTSGGGAVYAATKIGAKDIKTDAVRSKHLKNGQVKTQDLAASAVTGAKILDGSVTGPDVDESTLGQVPSAVTADALAGLGVDAFARSGVYKVESPIDTGTLLGDGTHTKFQACDSGDILLSGGPANMSGTSSIVESFPTPGITNGWSARIDDGGVTDNYSVVVLCLDQTT
jgi:hypothetical protein